MKLKNKRVLITAGPTWVPIDSVRVISNIATGETGILIAEELQNRGARVTLVLGPVTATYLNNKINLIRFKFFDELRDIIKKELGAKKYDVIIHSAAVSDFKPAGRLSGKLSSDKIHNLRLTPSPKIIRDIRRLAPKVKLVMFKLEAGIPDQVLIERARESVADYKADIVIANKIHPRYKAFILGRKRFYSRADSKKELAEKIASLVEI